MRQHLRDFRWSSQLTLHYFIRRLSMIICRVNESWIGLLLLTMTQVNNSPINVHHSNHTQPTYEMTPVFKLFTVLLFYTIISFNLMWHLSLYSHVLKNQYIVSPTVNVPFLQLNYFSGNSFIAFFKVIAWLFMIFTSKVQMFFCILIMIQWYMNRHKFSISWVHTFGRCSLNKQ